jgi:membrane-bound lytic murein transglycosylase D
MTTPKDQPFILNLPAGSRDKYQTAIALVPQDMRTYWRYHHVEYGDTVPALARKYHTSATSIAEANNLSGDDLTAGTKLIIPIAPTRQGSQTAAYSKHPTHYKVRKGDTVGSVADDFEVPVEKLRKWNHLRGSGELVAGRTLVIYKPVSSDNAEATTAEPKTGHAPVAHTGAKSKIAAASQPAKYHKVKKGETLSSIAESNHVSVADLKRDNPNLDAKVRAGEVLLIRK